MSAVEGSSLRKDRGLKAESTRQALGPSVKQLTFSVRISQLPCLKTESRCARSTPNGRRSWREYAFAIPLHLRVASEIPARDRDHRAARRHRPDRLRDLIKPPGNRESAV